MKKFIVLILILAFLMISFGCTTIASNEDGPAGPAPNSGDGVPDGSGLDNVPAPSGDGLAPGPADNSGDGVPDGSGF